MIRRVVLTGLSGSGKSSVGKLSAERLGWSLFDTDEVIEQRSGRRIPDIFRDDGEASFRSLEGLVMRDALNQESTVIATGGGAVLDPTVWDATLLGSPETLVVWIDSDPETLLQRLQTQAIQDGAAADRPLLSGADPGRRLREMREVRKESYARSDITLDVTHRPAEDIAADITELVLLGRGVTVDIDLQVENARSAIHIGAGARFSIGERIRSRWPVVQSVWVLVDGNLRPHVDAEIESLRTTSSAKVNVFPVPPGEGSKSLQGLGEIYDWMLGGGIERDDVVVAMGGGMVGDLAGFAAASVLRGVGLVQMPTTLLSMVDSSVGGKTGINHRSGKNLIGAFYQPPEVVIDPELLVSLPDRERRSGWAEIVKHAVIEESTPGGTPPVLLDVLERNANSLSALANPITPWVIRRNVALKAAVVRADEREAGIRAYLNFGHTIGHGIEAAGYSLLHGEAVAVGMGAALFIARELDLIEPDFEMRIRNLIEAFGLPLVAEVDPALVRRKMSSDKKKTAGRQKWVLPVRSGGVTIVRDVPDDLVDRAIGQATRRT